MHSYASEDFIKSLQMFLPSGSMDKDVIQINEEDAFDDEDGEVGVGHAWECATNIKQAERHEGELEQLATCAECSFVGIRRLQKDIPISRV